MISAEMVDRHARSLAESMSYAWHDAKVRQKLRKVSKAALTAALQGSVVVPAELTEDMRYATWFAQFKHSGATDAEAHTLTCRRMAENGQRILDQAAYRAMVATVSPVTRHSREGGE